MGQPIRNPFPTFHDNNGQLLEAGYIYIGESGLNPEVFPIDVFWDKDFLYPAAQPIRTINGLPSRAGTPSAIFTKFNDYSIKVKNKNNGLIYSALAFGGISSEYLDPVNTIAALRLVDVDFVNDTQIVEIKGYYAVGDGGGGHFYWNAISTETDNGGTIIQATGVATGRWIRLYSGSLIYKWFGLNEITDDDLITRHDGRVFAIGRNATNTGADYQGLQIGGGDSAYGSDGVFMAPDGHASWLRIQPTKNESAVEALIYSTTAQGIATATISTDQVTRVSGTAFDASWVGKRYYLGESIYEVATVTDGDNLTVQVVGGGAVSFASTFNETYHVVYIKLTGTCDVSGSTVTRVSGDPFVPFVSSIYSCKINGVARTISSFTDIDTYVLSAPPGDLTSVTYEIEVNINDQIVALRLQKVIGGDEENLSMYVRYDGYWMHSLYAGSGQYRKVIIGSGEITAGTLARQLVCHPNGDLSMGGDYDFEAIRILNQNGAVNRLETEGALTGLDISLRARGGDTNIGLAFDSKGNKGHKFTSHEFVNTEFEIYGTGGSSWLAATSSASDEPSIAAAGAATDIDIQLIPKGVGRVWIGAWTTNADALVNGYITVKDSTGATRKVATIA